MAGIQRLIARWMAPMAGAALSGLLASCSIQTAANDRFGIEIGMNRWDVAWALPWHGYQQLMHDCTGDWCVAVWRPNDADQRPNLMVVFERNSLKLVHFDFGDFGASRVAADWCRARLTQLAVDLSARYGKPILQASLEQNGQHTEMHWHAADKSAEAVMALSKEGPSLSGTRQCYDVSADLWAGDPAGLAAIQAALQHATRPASN
jgi:hypothetical protein